ncbi:MAG: phosphoribosyl-AMP cyclohydrolase, partial [Planctomycetota bacterium]
MSDPSRETGTTLDIKYDAKGLVPAIVQDHATGDILMMGWMNEAALQQTLKTKLATFYSRSRDKMWVKGESSGHTQEVLEARTDHVLVAVG